MILFRSIHKRGMCFETNQMLAFLLIPLLFLTADTNAQALFQSSFGSNGYEKGTVVKQLTDGTFIIGGEAQQAGEDETDVLLARADAGGNVLWTKRYGGSEREIINDLVQLPDRGFLLLAEKYQADRRDGEFLMLLRTDENGNLIWKKIIEETGFESEGFSMMPTPDGAYIIAGVIRKMSAPATAFFTMPETNRQTLYLLKTDAEGNKLWSKGFDVKTPGVSTNGIAVTVAKDGNCYITGNITLGETGNADDSKGETPAQKRKMLLLKVSSSGALFWAKEYEGNRVAAGFRIIEKSEGGLLVAGVCTPDASNNVDYFLSGIDADGKIEWTKTYGGGKFDNLADVVQMPDGGFVVSGSTLSFGAGASDALIIKTDKDGNVVWAKTYGTGQAEYGMRLALAPDGIVITGEASVAAESFDVMLLKTDFNGKSICWGSSVSLNTGTLQLKVSDVKNAELRSVEQQKDVLPDSKKTDVKNVRQQEIAFRNKKMCN